MLLLTRAAQAYERAASRTDGTYSLQNAALLWALAGDAQRALRLAGSVARRVTELNVPSEEEAAYFHWATLAEAALVLGDRSLLQGAVLRANPLCRQNSWARSRTFLQMRRLCFGASAMRRYHRQLVSATRGIAAFRPISCRRGSKPTRISRIPIVPRSSTVSAAARATAGGI